MRRTAPMMLRVVREIEQYGKTDFFAYAVAYAAARDYLGAKLPTMIGSQSEYQYNVKLLAICIAAHAMQGESPK
jgi:hypothetical protein